MSDRKPADPIEHVSALPFVATLERLVKTIEQAGLILFSRIDHRAGAHQAGLEMSPTTVLIYGHSMIPHHQGAIDMAQAELRYGHNKTLGRIA